MCGSESCAVFEGGSRRVERAVSLLLRIVPAVAARPGWGHVAALDAGRASFPRVPFVGWFAGVPAWLEWTAARPDSALASVVGNDLGLQAFGEPLVCGGVSALALGVLVLADQHRLQPWAYQFVVVQIVLAGLPAGEAIALTRLLIASIYFFSALSKFDRSFIDSGGGHIVEGLLRLLAAG